MRLSAGHLEEEATRSCGRTVWVKALSPFLKLERTLVSTSTKVKLHAAHTQSHQSAAILKATPPPPYRETCDSDEACVANY